MKMLKINKIDVMSFAKILGAIPALFGFILGLLIAIFSLQTIGGLMEIHYFEVFGFPFLSGIAAVIFLPIFYGLFGFMGGVIIAVLYNFLAKRIGGAKLETE